MRLRPGIDRSREVLRQLHSADVVASFAHSVILADVGHAKKSVRTLSLPISQAFLQAEI
jgi:hypothetical protein